ncbi:disintegrin and metalloproteinase domain-containing protein 10-like isoform X1 [Centruroides sculpturatus]|uniref:disintegrin and metalloproteinase domain-containing protein 10-like isoform X1 n=1 Tax=Centruroides sculpturatus TaxID=218467 RepID=UPI000C6CFA3F|nr:disintegrin and metalloproteinase domain-containing protein 10-like isoform X1 [Centruroides sculpturatus]
MFDSKICEMKMYWLNILMKIGIITLMNFYSRAKYENIYKISEYKDIWVTIRLFSYGEISVIFYSPLFGRKKLRVSRNSTIFSAATKVYLCTGKNVYKYHLKNMQGLFFVEGKSFFGYFYNNKFTGRLQFQDNTYYIEPYSDYLFDLEYIEGYIVYNLIDVKYTFKRHNTNFICNEITNDTESGGTDCNYAKFTETILNVKNTKSSKRSCSLELLADYTYFKRMKYNNERIVAQMMFYIMNANNIFKNLDIDEDGIADNIGFNVEKITIFQDENSPNYPFRQNINYTHTTYLDQLARYSHPYCMLICFCHRDFWTESTYSVGKVKKRGGICSREGSEDAKIMNNVGFVTDIERGFLLPKVEVAANVLHQLGHAFGCPHDPENCKLDDTNGHYIMHPDIPLWKTSSNLKFSPYCKKKIKQYLEKKEIDYCLKTLQRSVCGNGIVEEGESCDCDDSTGQCDIEMTCCTSRNSLLPCTIQEGKDCSPATDKCCDLNCRINTRDNIKCFSNVLCYNTSNECNNLSPFCPLIQEPDQSPCLGTAKTCRSGKCISNVCKDNKLKSCNCLSLKWECHICCESKPKICQSAESLGYVPSNHQLYVNVEGSLCDQNFGICTSNGYCSSKKSYSAWYYMSPLPFIALIIVALVYLPGKSKPKNTEDVLTTIQKKKVVKSQQKSKEEKRSPIQNIKQRMSSLGIKSKKDGELPTQDKEETQAPTRVKKKTKLPIRVKQKETPEKSIKQEMRGEQFLYQTQVQQEEQSTDRANRAKKVKVIVKKKKKPESSDDKN